MVRNRNRHDQFNRDCFCAFTIVKGRGPVTYCGEGLVVALHNVHSQLPLWREAHRRTQPSCHPWQGVCCRLLWREARCGPPQRMRPPWGIRHACPWQRTCLWQCTRRLWRIQCIWPRYTCAAGHCMARYSRHCILQMTTWNFDCCVGVISFFPPLCLLMSSPFTIRHEGMIVALATFASWRCNQSYCWRLAPLWLLMWLILIDHKVGCRWHNLACLLQSIVIAIPYDTTKTISLSSLLLAIRH